MNKNSKEYTQWVANVWRLNSQRNQDKQEVEKNTQSTCATCGYQIGYCGQC